LAVTPAETALPQRKPIWQRISHLVLPARGACPGLGVNNQSERGLLGIALHPDFPDNPGVYLYWTCRTAESPLDPFAPDQEECRDEDMLLPDTSEILQVPLRGHRPDLFEWDGSALVFDRNLLMLRTFQNDGGPVPASQGDEAQRSPLTFQAGATTAELAELSGRHPVCRGWVRADSSPRCRCRPGRRVDLCGRHIAAAGRR
jgi:hypothetical protein